MCALIDATDTKTLWYTCNYDCSFSKTKQKEKKNWKKNEKNIKQSSNSFHGQFYFCFSESKKKMARYSYCLLHTSTMLMLINLPFVTFYIVINELKIAICSEKKIFVLCWTAKSANQIKFITITNSRQLFGNLMQRKWEQHQQQQ